MSDIFCAWLGGVPEEREEVKDFLRSSGLSCLLSEHDLAEVFKGNVYFSEETFLAVYALIPVKLKAGGKELVLFPQVFNRLNLKAAEKPSARAVNIGLPRRPPFWKPFIRKRKDILMPTGKLCRKTTAKPGTKPILLRSISFIARRCQKKKSRTARKKQTAHAAPACRKS